MTVIVTEDLVIHWADVNEEWASSLSTWVPVAVVSSNSKSSSTFSTWVVFYVSVSQTYVAVSRISYYFVAFVTTTSSTTYVFVNCMSMVDGFDFVRHVDDYLFMSAKESWRLVDKYLLS